LVTLGVVAVGCGAGGGVAAGGGTSNSRASSKEIETGAAGRTMNLARTERAAGGACIGPVSRYVHAVDELVFRLSACESVVPLPSLEAYQLSLRKNSPSPVSRFPHASKAYQRPPATGTAW
jgi:hypothetical protein